MKIPDIHEAREHLSFASDDLLIATTCGGCYDRARFIDPAIERLKAAAALLGFDLVEREPAEPEPVALAAE